MTKLDPTPTRSTDPLERRFEELERSHADAPSEARRRRAPAALSPLTPESSQSSSTGARPLEPKPVHDSRDRLETAPGLGAAGSSPLDADSLAADPLEAELQAMAEAHLRSESVATAAAKPLSDRATPHPSRRRWPPPRSDASAMAFGPAFATLGVTGLLHAMGISLEPTAGYSLALVALGAGGLWGALQRAGRDAGYRGSR